MLGVGSIADYAVASYSRDGTIDTVTVDKGELTLTGSSILEAVTIPIVKGVLTLTGKDIQFYRVIVDHGSLSLNGMPVDFVTTIPVANGELSISGGSADFLTTFEVSSGTLTLTGSTVPSYTAIPVAGGALTLTGYPSSFMATLELESGQLTLTGQDFFVGRIIVEPGYLTLTGSEIPVVTTLPVENNQLHLRPGDPITLIPIGGASGSRRRHPKNYRTGFEPVTRKYVPAAKEPQRNPIPPFRPDAKRTVTAMPAPGGPKAVLDLKSLVGNISSARSEYIDQQDADDVMASLQDMDDIAAVLELLD